MNYKVFNPGKIIYEEGYYFDQLSGLEPSSDPSNYDGWVFKSMMKSYLYDKYNLSAREYYNIVVFGDINYTHICEYEDCEEETDFLTLMRGYNKGCCPYHSNCIGWYNEERRENQREVGRNSMIIINENLWYSEEYRDFRKRASERMSQVMTENNYDPEFNKAAVCSGNRSYALNHFGDNCVFYILTRDDYLKIGICGNIDNVYQKKNSYCPDYLIAVQGPTKELAELEYDIKMNNTAKWGNEFFDISRFEEFRKRIDNYELIYETE